MFLRRNKLAKFQRQLALVETETKEIEKQTIGFNWFNEDRKREGADCLKLAMHFYNQKNLPQTELQLRRLQQLTFEDFTERVEIRIVPLVITDSDKYNNRKIWFRTPKTQDRTDYRANHYDISEVPFLIPMKVLEMIERVKKFPISDLIEKFEIWDLKADPLLTIKVSGQWYSLLSWERFGPTIVLNET